MKRSYWGGHLLCCHCCGTPTNFYKAVKTGRMVRGGKKIHTTLWRVRLCEKCVVSIAGPRIAEKVLPNYP